MIRGLDALNHPRIKSAQVDISAEGKHDIAYMPFDYTKQYSAIKKDLEDYEEMKHSFNIITCENGDLLAYKQALAIILKKEVNIGLLKYYRTVEHYNVYKFYENEKLTKDEFNLLKEFARSY